MVNTDSSNSDTHSEAFTSFYDIFVRNAFGNYRDILKEVSYNPLMAYQLTYMGSKSTGYKWLNKMGVVQHPDEVSQMWFFHNIKLIRSL